MKIVLCARLIMTYLNDNKVCSALRVHLSEASALATFDCGRRLLAAALHLESHVCPLPTVFGEEGTAVSAD